MGPFDLYHFTRALSPPGGIADCVFAEMWQRSPRPQQTEWGRELLGIALASRAQGAVGQAAQPSRSGTIGRYRLTRPSCLMMPPGSRTSATIWEQGDWDKCLSALELVLSGWRGQGASRGGKDANQSAAAASELRDRAKKRLESLRRDALLCTAEEFAADRRRAAPLVAALVRVTQTFADNCFAANVLKRC